MMHLALVLAVLVPTDTVRERAVTIPGPVALGGVLTLPPTGSGPFPAVVLVHGSGAGDRDLTFGPNKPYRDIAHGLAARGVAVLRYDKRARVAPAWYASRAFTLDDETVDDAVSALGVLREIPEIDAARVFVIGHSLGGLAAPRIAAHDGKLAGVIMMAGAWVIPLHEMVLRQVKYMASVATSQADSTAIMQQYNVLEPLFESVRRLTPADSAGTAMIFGAPPSYWLHLRQYDPVRELLDRPGPVLILQGERDYQVTPADLDAFLERLGRRVDTRVRRYPGLNHLFMHGEGVPGPAEYTVAGHVSSDVIADIAAWIRERE